MAFGFYPQPPESYVVQSIRDSYASDTAENTHDTVHMLRELKEELARERAERIKSDRKTTAVAVATLVIAALTLIATIAVPIMLRH